MNTKTILFLISFILLHFKFLAQNCELTTRELIHQLTYKIDTIDAKTYENVFVEQNLVLVIQKPEEYFQKEYPNIFIKKGLCYYFKSIEGEELKACAIDTSIDFKENLQYEFKGIYCNNLLIYISGYESWGHLSVSLLDGMTFSTLGKPITSNCKLIYSYSQNYGEEEITIFDVATKKQLVLIIDSWFTDESKQDDNNIFFKMKSMNCLEKEIYLRVSIK
ncbi:MAG: hypothetical protein KDD24_04050 [Flavobacteriales bacterium]|nr:hypothetical protein [Flavobacteriales bacterium]MCB9173260.1 hypothetical protein [Flavobacteriales bacterium]